MYLKSICIENFRKFTDKDNIIEFIEPKTWSNNEFNMAPKTTLIVGKNNSGKTTIIRALQKLVGETNFCARDFNFKYLKEILETYGDSDAENLQIPFLRFILKIGIDANDEDILTNIIPFMSLGDIQCDEVNIMIKWQVKDKELFIRDVNSLNKLTGQVFDQFLKLIDKTEFEIGYYNLSGEKKEKFSLKNLIQVTSIEANNINKRSCLSEAFSKIIEYRYKEVIDKEIANDLEAEIIKINETLTEDISKNHTKDINDSLKEVIMSNKCKILLKSDLDFQKIIRNVIKYEYEEAGNSIPEEQFGLGYTNLMMIIAEIITYMEKYPEKAFNSKVNLISIEEPETFMHPQMQEQFMKNINEMIATLLKSKNKKINSQIIITTHSPHILNSKIYEGKTFNSINYITNIKNKAKAIPLNDDTVIGKKIEKKMMDEKVEKSLMIQEAAVSLDIDIDIENLKFLTKHIKYKVSELFFADAIILVEGITESILLQYYLDNEESLSGYYISIMLINGAHAKVYKHLINTLSIPTLIITDIDFKRTEKEKELYMQMTNQEIKDRETTNDTIKTFYCTNKIQNIIKSAHKEDNNIMIVCQKEEVEGYYATSFEEALVLKNIDNDILKNTLKEVKPRIYTEIVKNNGVKENSYKIQKKLSDCKSEFANKLLYEILVCDEKDKIPELPEYIKSGFDFLENKLKER